MYLLPNSQPNNCATRLVEIQHYSKMKLSVRINLLISTFFSKEIKNSHTVPTLYLRT